MSADHQSAPEVGLTEAERLAGVLGDIRVEGARRADWWESDAEHSLLIQVLRGECVPWAEGLLASDWLTERDAHIKADAIAQAKAEERERIAQAIEAVAPDPERRRPREDGGLGTDFLNDFAWACSHRPRGRHPMTCPAHLGCLCCTRTDVHLDGHTYRASSGNYGSDPGHDDASNGEA